jgi:hypothetical protein
MLATIRSRTFVYSSSVRKNYTAQNYNFACGFVWVRNLVAAIKGGTETEGVWEHGAENIWAEEIWSDWGLETTA